MPTFAIMPMDVAPHLSLGAGGLESILTLVAIVVLSALNSWLTKRKQEKEARENPPLDPSHDWSPNPPETAPPPFPQRPTAQGSDWEEELRRLLQGGPEKEPPPQAAPPPLPQPVPRESASPQPSWSRPIPRSSPPPDESEEGPGWDLPPLRESSTSLGRAHDIPENVAERLRQASAGISHHLEAESAMAYADQLEERVASHSRSAIQRSIDPIQTPIRRVDPEMARWIQALRNPATARTAFISGIVLGPPKALE